MKKRATIMNNDGILIGFPLIPSIALFVVVVNVGVVNVDAVGVVIINLNKSFSLVSRQ